MAIYLPHLLVFWAAKKGLNLAPDFLEKFGLRELPVETISAVNAQTFPLRGLFNLIISFWFASYVVASILISAWVSYFFFALQKNLLGQGALYFSSQAGVILAVVFFIGLLIFFFSLSIFSLLTVAPQSFKNYILAEQLSVGYSFDYKSSLKIALAIFLAFYFTLSPIIYLAGRDYRAVFENRIVANQFFDWTTRNYSFGDIYIVTISAEAQGQENALISIFMHFKDGRRMSFGQHSALTGNYAEISALYNILKRERADIEIIKPQEEVLDIVSAKTCPVRQSEFYSFFEIDRPVVPRPGCI